MRVIANMHCIRWVLAQDHETIPFAAYDKHGQSRSPSSGAKCMEFANGAYDICTTCPMIVDTTSLSLELRITQVAGKLTYGLRFTGNSGT